MWLQLAVLPARVNPTEQVHKITNLLRKSTGMFASMVSEAKAIAGYMLLHPDHMIAAFVVEEIDQFGF